MMDEMLLRIATSLPGFLLGIVCHEAAHAYAALRFGDNTAYSQGRLSLNPLVHFDLFGTIIIPAISILAGGIVFGYAKPVPVDPRNFADIRKGTFWVSFAGPLANLLLATSSIILLAVILTQGANEGASLTEPLLMMLQQSILINLVLFTFNLIPFPPLDGSKMLAIFLDYNTSRKFEELHRYSILFFIVLITTPIFAYLMVPAMIFKNYVLGIFLSVLS